MSQFTDKITVLWLKTLFNIVEANVCVALPRIIQKRLHMRTQPANMKVLKLSCSHYQDLFQRA